MGRKRDPMGEDWQYAVQEYRDKTGRLRRRTRKIFDRCQCGRAKRTQARVCIVCHKRRMYLPLDELLKLTRMLMQAYEDVDEMPEAELARLKKILEDDWQWQLVAQDDKAVNEENREE